MMKSSLTLIMLCLLTQKIKLQHKEKVRERSPVCTLHLRNNFDEDIIVCNDMFNLIYLGHIRASNEYADLENITTYVPMYALTYYYINSSKVKIEGNN